MQQNEITDYIFIEDADHPADVALVFGTSVARREAVDRAAGLYERGLVPKIVVSGGGVPAGDASEAELLARGLTHRGIPDRDILIEDRSTNTLENVLLSREVIDREIGLDNVGTVAAIVKNYHARRALMTLKRHMPQHVSLRTAVYVTAAYGFTRDDWHRSALGRERVTGELERISRYLAKGDLAEL